MEFTKAYLDTYLNVRKNQSGVFARLSDVVLREVLTNHQDDLSSAMLSHYQNNDMSERDLNFVLDTFTGDDRDIYINKIFDLALTKQQFSYTNEYKKILMHHFAKRKIPAFKKYLDRALDPTNPLFLINEGDGKYIAKRIASSKIKITTHQANFLLQKIRAIKTNEEAQYLLFLRVIDYLSNFSAVGYKVFEEKFHQLLGNRVWPMKDSSCVEILRICRDETLRYRLAKEFLKKPYGSESLKKKLAKNFPDIQRLFNME